MKHSVVFDEEGNLEGLLPKTYYAGERILLRGKKGEKGVLVSQEDFDFLEKIENLLNGACYSGERLILQGKEGSKVGIVPLEDLELLERIAP
ncbi:hypothetical protein [Candidatus Neptunochlamydia vexilliferae]|uniref:Uncharacterized protein n=1 Tax=Candidatus Neptunichlamydia vexilliferae TaxID=1651774 RepID=A0ABS0AZZ5_9BACT|nr:hypothetical protein [Candidatus Neptunochlamydia vexilliferae]MBF5059708.1 hypothetical protein [Candidatus Neptunochlamydia vexilliferae]